MVRSMCHTKDNLDDKIACLVDEGRLDVFDVSGDFDDSHNMGVHQIYHAMVVLGDDVYEMNARALMPNGINLWAGEVWEYDDFRERKKDFIVNKPDLMSDQMKKAIWRRFEED